MSSLTSPRGPLPARVYWFRRALVLGAAFVLVLGLARVLGGGSDADDGGATAAQVGSDASQDSTADQGATTTADPSAGPTEEPSPTDDGREERGGRGAGTAQAEPEVICNPEDVVAEPVVLRPLESAEVLIGLDVSAGDSPACYFDVSADALTVNVTSGDDDIWSTRQCPAAVPERRAVLREGEPARVIVEWSGRRADEECSTATEYALPGYYYVEAAALAGEPSSVQFQLRPPPRPEITRSPSPSQQPSQQPSREPVRPDPSGAVEPDGE